MPAFASISNRLSHSQGPSSQSQSSNNGNQNEFGAGEGGRRAVSESFSGPPQGQRRTGDSVPLRDGSSSSQMRASPSLPSVPLDPRRQSMQQPVPPQARTSSPARSGTPPGSSGMSPTAAMHSLPAVAQLLNARKVYRAGYLYRLDTAAGTGTALQHTLADSGGHQRSLSQSQSRQQPQFVKYYMRLEDCILCFWSDDGLKAAQASGKVLHPTSMNLTDAFVALSTSQASWTSAMQKYESPTPYGFVLNSAGSNQIFFATENEQDAIRWVNVIRLAIWERQRLETLYTVTRLGIREEQQRQPVRSALSFTENAAKLGRAEALLDIRLPGDTEWKRVYAVLTEPTLYSSSKGANAEAMHQNTPPSSPPLAKKKKRQSFLGGLLGGNKDSQSGTETSTGGKSADSDATTASPVSAAANAHLEDPNLGPTLALFGILSGGGQGSVAGGHKRDRSLSSGSASALAADASEAASTGPLKLTQRPFLTVHGVYSAYAVWPEHEELVPHSKMFKIHGTIVWDESELQRGMLAGFTHALGGLEEAMHRQNRDAGRGDGQGEVLCMLTNAGAHQGGPSWAVKNGMRGDTQAELLSWCLGIYDAFRMYGRPQRLIYDPRHPLSAYFSQPIGPARGRLYFDPEIIENLSSNTPDASKIGMLAGAEETRPREYSAMYLRILFERMRNAGAIRAEAPMPRDLLPNPWLNRDEQQRQQKRLPQSPSIQPPLLNEQRQVGSPRIGQQSRDSAHMTSAPLAQTRSSESSRSPPVLPPIGESEDRESRLSASRSNTDEREELASNIPMRQSSKRGPPTSSPPISDYASGQELPAIQVANASDPELDKFHSPAPSLSLSNASRSGSNAGGDAFSLSQAFDEGVRARGLSRTPSPHLGPSQSPALSGSSVHEDRLQGASNDSQRERSRSPHDVARSIASSQPRPDSSGGAVSRVVSNESRQSAVAPRAHQHDDGLTDAVEAVFLSETPSAERPQGKTVGDPNLLGSGLNREDSTALHYNSVPSRTASPYKTGTTAPSVQTPMSMGMGVPAMPGAFLPASTIGREQQVERRPEQQGDGPSFPAKSQQQQSYRPSGLSQVDTDLEQYRGFKDPQAVHSPALATVAPSPITPDIGARLHQADPSGTANSSLGSSPVSIQALRTPARTQNPQLPSALSQMQRVNSDTTEDGDARPRSPSAPQSISHVAHQQPLPSSQNVTMHVVSPPDIDANAKSSPHPISAGTTEATSSPFLSRDSSMTGRDPALQRLIQQRAGAAHGDPVRQLPDSQVPSTPTSHTSPTDTIAQTPQSAAPESASASEYSQGGNTLFERYPRRMAAADGGPVGLDRVVEPARAEISSNATSPENYQAQDIPSHQEQEQQQAAGHSTMASNGAAATAQEPSSENGHRLQSSDAGHQDDYLAGLNYLAMTDGQDPVPVASTAPVSNRSGKADASLSQSTKPSITISTGASSSSSSSRPGGPRRGSDNGGAPLSPSMGDYPGSPTTEDDGPPLSPDPYGTYTEQGQPISHTLSPSVRAASGRGPTSTHRQASSSSSNSNRNSRRPGRGVQGGSRTGKKLGSWSSDEDSDADKGRSDDDDEDGDNVAKQDAAEVQAQAPRQEQALPEKTAQVEYAPRASVSSSGSVRRSLPQLPGPSTDPYLQRPRVVSPNAGADQGNQSRSVSPYGEQTAGQGYGNGNADYGPNRSSMYGYQNQMGPGQMGMGGLQNQMGQMSMSPSFSPSHSPYGHSHSPSMYGNLNQPNPQFAGANTMLGSLEQNPETAAADGRAMRNAAVAQHGLLQAGLQHKQDMSAKQREEVARETGGTLVTLDPKAQAPAGGLIGAIASHERDKKSAGGLGATLTERDRERRMAEQRQREMDMMQQQQRMSMGSPFGFGGQTFGNSGFGGGHMDPAQMQQQMAMLAAQNAYLQAMAGFNNPMMGGMGGGGSPGPGYSPSFMGGGFGGGGGMMPGFGAPSQMGMPNMMMGGGMGQMGMGQMSQMGGYGGYQSPQAHSPAAGNGPEGSQYQNHQRPPQNGRTFSAEYRNQQQH